MTNKFLNKYEDGSIVEILVEKPIPVDEFFPPLRPITNHGSFTRKHYQLTKGNWKEVTPS
jgi:hypothetical protein